jgi:hypothetical protein
MTRARLVTAGLVALAACGDTTTTPITQLNLDRPVDVAFACYGAMRVTNGGDPAANQPVIQTAMPAGACEFLSPPLTPRRNATSMKVDGTGPEIATTPVYGQGAVAGATPTPNWYAFLLQSSTGTVAVATWTPQPSEKMINGQSDFHVVDADPLTPGKNAISIGEDPISIVTDKPGCFEVTANAGSCDLSELEINSALDNIASGSSTPTPVRINRVPIKNRAGQTLLARPAAMVAEPAKPPVPANPDDPNDHGTVGDPAVGNACPGNASGKIYVAFPSCHLVAGIDTASGMIVSAISFDTATGAASVLTGAALDSAGASCPAECSASGTTPGGGFTPGARPVALDLQYDTRVDLDPMDPNSKPAPTMRLAIGAENLSKLTMIDLDIATFAPATLFQVPLEDNTPNKTLGVTTLALSLQIGMGGDATASGTNQRLTDNTTVDRQAQFVYAVATDGTVRVADVLHLKHECDTQVDGRFLRNTTLDVTKTMCIDNTAGTQPRHVGARGPGIEIPAPGIPTSVAIVKARETPPHEIDTAANPPVAKPDLLGAAPGILVGHFAVITAASGNVYVVNVDDDFAPDSFVTANPLKTQPVLVMAHQLRDSFSDREALPIKTVRDSVNANVEYQVTQCRAIDPPTGGGTSGGPRVSAAPAQVPPTNTISSDLNPELPKLRQSQCVSDDKDSAGILIGDAAKPAGVAITDLEFGATRLARDQTFPDLKSLLSETWTITYQGTLSLDNAVTAIDGPTIREGTIKVNEFGLHLLDQNRAFCDMGVERYDVAELKGCDPSHNDADCPANYTCFVHPKSSVAIGACMLKTEAQRLSDVCFDFLTTLRHYTVDQTKSGELVLLERKHELPMTPVDGCVDDNQCNNLAALQFRVNPGADPYLGAPGPNHPGTTWSCQNDPLRKPINADPAKDLRCVQTCSIDTAHPAACSSGSLCRLNPGSQTEGVCMEGIEPPQSCVNGPQRFDVRASEAFTMIGSQSGYIHPIVMKADGTCGRDPKAPSVQIGRFPLTAPACTSTLPGQPPTPNPCQTTVAQFDLEPKPMSCSTTLDEPTNRMATAIVVSTPAMTLNVVDPTYPGDGPCFLDRLGGLGNIPFVNTGYQIQFEQKAGFQPVQLQQFGAVSPVRVLRGPSASIWIVDDGDLVSTSITQASTRGRVYRIESTTLVSNILE